MNLLAVSSEFGAGIVFTILAFMVLAFIILLIISFTPEFKRITSLYEAYVARQKNREAAENDNQNCPEEQANSNHENLRYIS